MAMNFKKEDEVTETFRRLPQMLLDDELLKSLSEEYRRHIGDFIPDWIGQINGDRVSDPLIDRLFTVALNITNYIKNISEHASKFIVGSCREGTAQEGAFSDVDVMNIIWTPNPEETEQMVLEIDGYPGFALVEFSKAGEKTMSAIGRYGGIVGRRIYLSGNKLMGIFWDKNSDHYDPEDELELDRSCALGVAARYKDRNGRYDSVHDITMAISCKAWPDAATAWKNRPRHWPSQELVDDIISSGYLLVPKAAQNSPLKSDLQWRISFSFAEIKLLDDLEDIPLLVFKLIKQIFKYRQICQRLTTYHLKTVILWMCEENPSSWWSDSRLLECISCVFSKILQTSAVEKKLPHYFIEHINLFENVSHNETSQWSKQLNRIIQSLEVESNKIGSDCNSLESGFIQILMLQRQVQRDMALNLVNTSRNIFPLQTAIEWLDIRQTVEFCNLSHYAMQTCLLHETCTDAARKAKVNAVEYLLNCFYAVSSFAMQHYQSRLTNIKKAWSELFPNCEIPALVFLKKRVKSCEILWEEKCNGKYDLSDPETLFRLTRKTIDECKNLQFTISKKIQHTFLKNIFDFLYGRNRNFNVMRSLKIEDFIPGEILGQLDDKFELPKENHLTIHDMADPDIWIKQLTYDEMLSKVAYRGHRKCTENCFTENMDISRKLLEKKKPLELIQLHRIHCDGQAVLYANSSEIRFPFLMRESIVAPYFSAMGRPCSSFFDTLKYDKL